MITIYKAAQTTAKNTVQVFSNTKKEQNNKLIDSSFLIRNSISEKEYFNKLNILASQINKYISNYNITKKLNINLVPYLKKLQLTFNSPFFLHNIKILCKNKLMSKGIFINNHNEFQNVAEIINDFAELLGIYKKREPSFDNYKFRNNVENKFKDFIREYFWLKIFKNKRKNFYKFKDILEVIKLMPPGQKTKAVFWFTYSRKYYKPNYHKQNINQVLFCIFSDFLTDEFNEKLKIETLWNNITKNDYKISYASDDKIVRRLNIILETPNFYTVWLSKNNEIELNQETITLIEETNSYRNRNFNSLPEEQQLKIKRLNRLLLEQTYPDKCPKSTYNAGDCSDFTVLTAYLLKESGLNPQLLVIKTGENPWNHHIIIKVSEQNKTYIVDYQKMPKYNKNIPEYLNLYKHLHKLKIYNISEIKYYPYITELKDIEVNSK